jgi:hypothetical protein
MLVAFQIIARPRWEIPWAKTKIREGMREIITADEFS